ncbi:MAG: insulinase family protein, partial [Flavobacteriaceae bacterium]|nr:insulinase family protein [Flavobacteriaceae bacterium]
MKRISKILIFVCVLAVSLNSINAQNYTLPEFTTYQMDNGLTVYLMEQRDVPLISVSAILPAGAIYDGDQAGLAQLTAAALKHGTRSYTKAQVDESLDF